MPATFLYLKRALVTAVLCFGDARAQQTVTLNEIKVGSVANFHRLC